MKIFMPKAILALSILCLVVFMACPVPTDSTAIVSRDKVSPTVGTLKQVVGGSFYNGAATVTVSTFYMMQYDVTRTMYKSLTGLDPHASGSTQMGDPATMVSWYDALVFCNKLSLAEHLSPVYTINGSSDSAAWGTMPTGSPSTWDAAQMNISANGYRLPTEMEYLWAAMGGESDSQSADFAGGVTIGGYAKGYAGSGEAGGAQAKIGGFVWYSANSGGTIHPAGSKAANELGIYDLSGNVKQWVWDWYAAYGLSPQIDPTGPATGTLRSLCGSAYTSDASSTPIAQRTQALPDTKIYINVGFRVVRR